MGYFQICRFHTLIMHITTGKHSTKFAQKQQAQFRWYLRVKLYVF